MRYGIIGGDMRNQCLIKQMNNLKHEIITYKNEINIGYNTNDLNKFIDCSDIIIGPMPLSRVKGQLNAPFINEEIYLDDLFSKMKHKLFISGNIDDDSIIKLDKNSNKVYDLMTLDSFAIYNAIATAEGTIANLILESNYNLYNESVLILGFGKCGKILADRLKGLGSKVTIAARKMQDEAFIESLSYGFINYKNLRTNIKNFKFIINTVPTLLIKKEELDNVSNETLIIDIASKPGGIDFTYAKEKNIKCLHLLGIPGKFAPESSASIIYNMIQKLGE